MKIWSSEPCHFYHICDVIMHMTRLKGLPRFYHIWGVPKSTESLTEETNTARLNKKTHLRRMS